MDDQKSSPHRVDDERAATGLTQGDKLRGIQSVTDAALFRLGPEELLDALAERVRQALRADTAGVLLLDPASRHLVATAASGLEDEVRQGVRVPVGKDFAGRVAAQGRGVVLNEVDHTKIVNPLLLDKGIRSLMGAPLRAGGDGDRRDARRHLEPTVVYQRGPGSAADRGRPGGPRGPGAQRSDRP
ncbi:MAG TPA: GAF domain-containing protein [Streptosporangiaceae bacterium]|nr:GAF domain-containing protein [Streptosporangiaceae bacterium]